MEPLAPGKKVGEHLQVVRVMGQGIGITYEAKDVRSGQAFALNELELPESRGEILYERLVTEASTLEQLSHSGVPRYVGHHLMQVGQTKRFYYVQELVRGKSLMALAEEGWRPGESEARELALAILDILSYLHGHRPPAVHCDIKPSNILRDEEDKLFLVDLGTLEQVYLTLTDGASRPLGAMGYVAPELARGRPLPTSDLYGLGGCLIYIMTHSPPGRLPQQRLMVNLQHHCQVSDQFAAFVDGLQEPVPEDRLQSANEAMTALRLGTGASPSRSEKQSSGMTREALALPVRRFPVWAALSIVLALALGVMTVLYLQARSAPAPDSAPTAPSDNQPLKIVSKSPTKQGPASPPASQPADQTKVEDQLQPPVKPNHALKFVNQDNIQVSRSDSLRPASSSLTLSTWFKVQDGKRQEQTLAARLRPVVVLVRLDIGSPVEIRLHKQILVFGGADVVKTPKAIRYGVWQHVAGTYDHDARLLKIHLNGKEVARSKGEITPGAQPQPASLTAGGRVSGVAGMDVALPRFNVVLDELRYWGYARKPEQIRAAMKFELSGLEKGLLGYWSFNRGKGQQVMDYAPAKNHGWRGGHPKRKDVEDPAWVRDTPYGR